MPGRPTLIAGPVGLALLAVLGTVVFIAGDLLGPGVLRPIGGGLALGGYAGLVALRRPAQPRAEVEAGGPGEARHVA